LSQVESACLWPLRTHGRPSAVVASLPDRTAVIGSALQVTWLDIVRGGSSF